MQKIIILAILNLLGTSLYAQNNANVWYFGDHAGLDFNSGVPIALTDGMINSWEGTSTVSDANGSMLFYTDGITVWDKNHNVMLNGDSLGGGSSATQSALIVSIAGNNLFYIFTVENENTPTDNLRYSVVDLSLNNGDGDVTIKNAFLISQTTEKLSAVNNANNTGLWVMTHGNGTNSFYGFLLDGSGVDSVPVISNIGQSFGMNGDNVGQMKFSPDGTKIAVAAWNSNFVELFDFNSTTGVVSNNILINIPYAVNGVYGLEFSPASNYLYASNVIPGNIYQWDITSNSSVGINSTIQQIGNSSSSYRGALQLGPDGKIYVARNLGPSLGVINNPDLPGTQCNFIENSVSLAGKKSGLGLPNFIQTYFLPTGMNQLNEKILLSVHPNPFTSIVSIAFKKQNLKQVSVTIRNVLGSVVLSESESHFGSAYSKTIDLNFLSKGIYFFEIVADGERTTRKMVKE